MSTIFHDHKKGARYIVVEIPEARTYMVEMFWLVRLSRPTNRLAYLHPFQPPPPYPRLFLSYLFICHNLD